MKYWASFQIINTMKPEQMEHIVQHSEQALEVHEIADVCIEFSVEAKLYNDAGFLVGHVDQEGDWKLGV